MEILIIGGSRFVGPVIIRKLLEHGHNLTVFNRGYHKIKYDKKIKFVQGDRSQKINLKDHFDAVIDMCAYNVDQLKNAVDCLSFDYFLNFGSAASYKKTEIFPLTELSPLGSWPLWADYNIGKVKCERYLETQKIKYSSIRPVYILGENNYIDREKFIYKKILRDKKITIPGNGQAICQFAFSEEVADVVVFLVENKMRGAFNIAGDELITLKGLVDLMANITGRNVIIDFNPLTDGPNYDSKEFPFANENFICSNKKLKTMGISFLPLEDTLKLQYKNYYQKVV